MVDPLNKLNDARDFIQSPNQTDFLVVRKRNSGPHVGKLNIGRTAQAELNEIVVEAISNKIDSIRDGDTQIRELDVANTISGESIIQYTNSDNLPDSEIFELLTTRRNYETTVYSEDPEPNFQLIRIADSNGKMVIGVQNYQNTTLVETTSALAMLFSDNEYEKFGGDMIVVRPNLNALYFDGHIFVITPKSFESMFDMRREYEEHAQNALDKYEDTGIRFQDEGKIKNWLLSHINMLREMYDIQQSGLPERTEPSDLVELVENFDLNVNYEMEDGEILLDVEEYTDSWQLLRLLGAKYAETEQMDTRWEIDQGRRLD